MKMLPLTLPIDSLVQNGNLIGLCEAIHGAVPQPSNENFWNFFCTYEWAVVGQRRPQLAHHRAHGFRRKKKESIGNYPRNLFICSVCGLDAYSKGSLSHRGCSMEMVGQPLNS
jgi:hypothetical protein